MKGIPTLVLATVCMAPFAAAVPLDLDNPQGIAAIYSVGLGVEEAQTFVVCTDGSGYHLEVQFNSVWSSFTASPVPLDEVVDWTPWLLYTTDNRWFARSDMRNPWEELGLDLPIPVPPCFEPVDVKGQSLGALKDVFE